MKTLANTTGESMVLYHGTNAEFDILDPAKTVDGGLHFGSLEQARMRNSKRIIQARVELGRIRRSRDRGGDWKGRIQSAKAQGYGSIVYLNRYEGVPFEELQRALNKGVDLDRISDREFKKHIPQARDSWIVFDPRQIRVLEVIQSYRRKEMSAKRVAQIAGEKTPRAANRGARM